MSENTPPQDTTAPGAAEAATPETTPDLAAQVAELQAKNAELADLYLRAQADVQNARRRADDEIAKSRKFAVEGFAESLLPVIDSLEAGLAIPNATIEQIREGSEAGTKFDPAQHQAISMVPAEQEANTVVAVLQKGYLIAERVLRPALVTVAAPK
jgi:molecular chaperone GrpE